MANLGTLSVNLTAQTAAFARGMKSAAGVLGRFSRGVAGSAARVTAFGSGLLTLATGGGFTVLLARELQSIDRTSKLSDELGVATEALVGFQFAAGITGTSTENINKGIQRMLRNLGNAVNAMDLAKGSVNDMGEAIAASASGYYQANKQFEVLGLSAEKLIKLSPEDALAEIAQKIKELPDTARRAAAAYNIFGRTGQELINFLLLGKKGIADLKAETKKFGTSFNRFDGSKVEALNDALLRMKESIRGVGTQIAIGLAPSAQGWVDTLTEKIQGAAHVMRDLVDIFINDWKGAGRLIESVFDGVLRKLERGVLELGHKLHLVSQHNLDVFDQTTALTSSNTGNIFIELQDAAAQRRAAEDAEFQRKWTEEQLRGGKDWIKNLGSQTTAAEDAAAAAAELQDKMTRGAAVVAETRTPVENFRSKIADLNSLLQAGAIDWRTYSRAALAAAKAVEETGKQQQLARINQGAGLAQAAGRGSAEAVSAINRRSGDRLRDQMQDVLKRQFNEAKKQTAIQSEVARLLAKERPIVLDMGP